MQSTPDDSRKFSNGKPAVHPICGDELRMLTAPRKDYPDSGYVFTTERGTPFTPDAINRLVKTIGQRAWRRGRPDALLHHSDRGSQYTCPCRKLNLAGN